MPQGQATPKASAKVTYFYLQTQDDVIPAMTALLTIDHDSQIRAYKVSGASTWDFTIEDKRPGTPPEKASKHATLGDVLVWDNANLTVMRIEDFQSKYSVP